LLLLSLPPVRTLLVLLLQVLLLLRMGCALWWRWEPLPLLLRLLMRRGREGAWRGGGLCGRRGVWVKMNRESRGRCLGGERERRRRGQGWNRGWWA
jgi:hypothetical protein